MKRTIIPGPTNATCRRRFRLIIFNQERFTSLARYSSRLRSRFCFAASFNPTALCFTSGEARSSASGGLVREFSSARLAFDAVKWDGKRGPCILTTKRSERASFSAQRRSTKGRKSKKSKSTERFHEQLCVVSADRFCGRSNSLR